LPGLLNSFDRFCFHNERTQSIWRTKKLYAICLVSQRMLSGKGCAIHADLIKCLMVVMKPSQSIFELCQQLLSHNTMMGNVTELKECSEAP
jgi:hypothetical protein